MNKRKALLGFIIFCFITGGCQTASAVQTPSEEIRSTIDSILNVLRDKSLSLPAKKAERREMIFTSIRKSFDFEEMAKRSLARHWQERTSEEKKEFISLFSQLLEASYISKIETYTDEKIIYDRETIDSDSKYGEVKTSIATKDLAIPIDYKLIRKGDRWFVYDVLIEGVSFISTYRSQYNKIILKESYDALLKKMKNKLEEVNTLYKL